MLKLETKERSRPSLHIGLVIDLRVAVLQPLREPKGRWNVDLKLLRQNESWFEKNSVRKSLSLQGFVFFPS